MAAEWRQPAGRPSSEPGGHRGSLERVARRAPDEPGEDRREVAVHFLAVAVGADPPRAVAAAHDDGRTVGSAGESGGDLVDEPYDDGLGKLGERGAGFEVDGVDPRLADA